MMATQFVKPGLVPVPVPRQGACAKQVKIGSRRQDLFEIWVGFGVPGCDRHTLTRDEGGIYAVRPSEHLGSVLVITIK